MIMEVLLWVFGKKILRFGRFDGPLVKSHFFPNSLHLSQDSTPTFCISLSFPLCHRIDPTELRHKTLITSLEVS
jgi:hypothetical protein